MARQEEVPSCDPALTLGAAAFAPEDCPICFEPMGGDCPLQRLSCGHGFHHSCIQRWLGRSGSCPLCKAPDAAGVQAADSGPPAFRIDLGHQEMASMLQELEDIFRAVHALESAGPGYPVSVRGLAYNLCASLGYEDEDELEEAIGGGLADFLGALPHFEVLWTEPAEGGETEPKARMRPEPEEGEGEGLSLRFTVAEREDLWRVVLQGPRAEVAIPELEFAIRPKAHRRVDTVYNLLAGAIFDLGDHVQKNRRLGGRLSEDEATKIAEAIDGLNRLLDLEQPFTLLLEDPQGVSEVKPADGVHRGSLEVAEADADAGCGPASCEPEGAR